MAGDPPLSQKTNCDLTQQALDRFLETLEGDRDAAGVRCEQLRSKLIRFFEWRGSAPPDENADETLSRMIRKIEAGEEIRDCDTYYWAAFTPQEKFRQP